MRPTSHPDCSHPDSGGSKAVKPSISWLCAALLLAASTIAASTIATGQATRRASIGYLFPAGGQRGAVVRITAGGQYLRGARKAYVSGDGVHANVIRYIRPLRNLNGDQRKLLIERIRGIARKRQAERRDIEPQASAAAKSAAPRETAKEARKRRRAEARAAKQAKQAKKARAKAKGKQKKAAPKKPVAKKPAAKKPAAKKPAAKAGAKPSRAQAPRKTGQAAKDPKKAPPPVRLPDHPLFDDFDNKSLRELTHIVTILTADRRKRQLNRQLAEWVLLEITIHPDALPGDREIRLEGPMGLSNPLVFRVGEYPEVTELEPNNRAAYPVPRPIPGLPDLRNLPSASPHTLPAVFNGQIMPGDVDRFRFRARKGQSLVFAAEARKLIPYLADAVPGWFQATLALYDAAGNEIAFADDFRFHPDPVLYCRIPETGEYELEVRDAIYRGREDFVYRITVGEQPFITHMFPLGGRVGVRTEAVVGGWNLPTTHLTLPTPAAGPSRRLAGLRGSKGWSNQVPYAVGTLPECTEAEPNDSLEQAQQVALPVVVNGRVGRPGDVDVFRISGRRGEKVVAEVYGRRLNSPLDSVLRVTDAAGKVVAWNDDHVEKDGFLHKDEVGLVTHHADSYLTATLPGDGVYLVQLTDAQGQGGPAWGYRLRITPPRPDFALRVTPSSLNMRGGQVLPITLHALRLDGYDGAIEVALEDQSGFALSGGRIPAGRNRIAMTLQAPRRVEGSPVRLELQGRAHVGGAWITHRAVPADNVMQAFLYRHLVPTGELRVAVQPVRWRVPITEVLGEVPVRVADGGSTRVWLRAWRGHTLELRQAPKGVSIADVKMDRRGLSFELRVEKGALPVGYADNLLVEGFSEINARQARGRKKTPGKKQRNSIGFLPAVPFEVVHARQL